MAGWGSGSKVELPVGTHVHYINGGKETTGKDFNDPNIEVPQFEFDCQYQIEGTEEWKSRKIWTKTDFKPWDSIGQAKHIPKLMKIIKACGLASPQSQAEAQAWTPDMLQGQYFRVQVEENEDDRFVPMPGVTPGPGAIKGKGKAQTEAPKPPPPAPSGNEKSTPKAPPPPPVPPAAAAAVTGADDYE